MSYPEAETMSAAAKQLAKSEKGRAAMRGLLAWLEDDGVGLDSANLTAVVQLLLGAWGRYGGTARDAMRAELGK